MIYYNCPKKEEKEEEKMEISSIERSRDLYTIFTDCGQTVKYDAETNTFYGISGKPLRSNSWVSYGVEIGRFLRLTLQANLDFKSSEDKNFKEILDRIISLPLKIRTKNQLFCELSYNNFAQYREKILKNWKLYIKYVRAIEENNSYLLSYNFNTFLERDEIQKYFNNSLSEELLKLLVEAYFDFDLVKKYKLLRNTIQKINKKQKEIELNRKNFKEVLNELSEKCDVIITERTIQKNNIMLLFQRIRKIDNLVLELGLENYEIKDVNKSLKELTSMVVEKEEELFTKRQKDGKLEFSTEEFKVIVPTTRKELAHYGNIFKNCLNGWEWDTRLKEGLYYVVIIQDLVKNTPVICADISTQTNIINQFLGKCNKSIRTARELKFKLLYQKYLLSVEKGE